MLRQLNRQINWIIEPTRSGAKGQLDSVFPMVFDRYYKIYLPLAFSDAFPEEEYPALPDTVEEINRRSSIGKLFFTLGKWEQIKPDLLRPIYLEELAEMYGLDFNDKLTIQQVYRKLGKKPIKLQRSMDYELELINRLTNWLGANTKIRIFDFGNFQLADLDKKYGQDWIEKTTLSNWSTIFQSQNDYLNQPFPYLSAYIFDKDKKWCLAAGSGLGSHYLWMATSAGLGEELEGLDGVRVVRVDG